ncbi:MAG: hypothetical protein WEA28_12470, partial [Xanthobacteraceae bacterium]
RVGKGAKRRAHADYARTKTVGFAALSPPYNTVLAQAQAPLGMGGVRCSEYLKAARASGILYHQASNWLLGYLSGVTRPCERPAAPPLSSISPAARR